MQIRTNHIAVAAAFKAAGWVIAGTLMDAAKGLRFRAECGVAAVVFVANYAAKVLGVEHDVANKALGPGSCMGIKQANPRDSVAICGCKAVAK